MKGCVITEKTKRPSFAKRNHWTVMEGEKTTALLYEVLIVAIMRFMVLGRQKH